MHLATAEARALQHSTPLRLADFEFEYPRELVARYPANPRESARLMVASRATGQIEHRSVADLPEFFGPADVLVANDTMVFPARLMGTKERTDARVEVFLLRELNRETRLWDAIVEPARKVRVGNKLHFGGGLAAEVIDHTTSRGRTVRFVFDGTPEAFDDAIERVGQTPLPRYLGRRAEPADKVRYQSVFAEHRGGVSAPAAALHFTPDLLAQVRAHGAEVHTATLHTGIGTFRPLEIEDVAKHRMDAERFRVSAATAEAVNRALRRGTVTVCSATTVRALESSLTADRTLRAGAAWTDKFIHSPYHFHITQRLLTNFQMPRSPLLVTAAAFAGLDLIRHAYEEAIRHEYRLFAFGDALLIV